MTDPESETEAAARALLDDRVAIIRELSSITKRTTQGHVTLATEERQAQAQLRQSLNDARARLALLQREAKDAFAAAVKAGWTPDELKQLGFAPPTAQRRARRRRAPQNDTTTTSAAPTPPASTSDTDDTADNADNADNAG